MLLELYQTFDGESAGAVRLEVEENGGWRLKDRTGKVSREGRLASMEELRNYLSYWKEMAARRANGWAEPEYGGCDNPIRMASIRFGDLVIHSRKELHSEFQDLEMDNREKTVLALIRKVKSLIPEINAVEILG
jgi:hypothetical protein